MEKKSRNDIEETSEEYEVLPDYFVFENEGEKSGYRKEGIYFLSFMRAKQLFEKGLPVLLLYSDKSEKPVKEIEEMFRHDGKYGIEKSAWQEYLETKEGQGFIRACNLATEAASGIVTRIQTDRGEFIEDWFDDIRFGAENAYENYLDDRYEKEWSGVRGEEIEEESDEEYYATVRPHIRRVMEEVKTHEVAFAEEYRKSLSKEMAKLQSESKAELRKAIVRAEELNTVIAKLYEDKVLGKLPEERFDALAKKFESEQGELKARAEELQNALAIADDEERNLQEFIKTVKRYTEITELDTEILNSLIERIEIGERMIDADGTRHQQIKICYLCRHHDFLCRRKIFRVR